jgi:hypothetical protein
MRREDGSLALRQIQREFFNFSDCCHEEKYNARRYESKRWPATRDERLRCAAVNIQRRLIPKASLLFYGLHLQRICASRLNQFKAVLIIEPATRAA